MQASTTRSITVAVRHPTPLVANGAVFALSQENNIQAKVWQDGHAMVADLFVTDHETAIRLAADRSSGHSNLRCSRLAVIGSNGREAEVRAALEAGVDGYVLALCSVSELLACVRTVASGGRYFSEGVLRCVADSLTHETLTQRELSVLQCMWKGLCNKSIANQLGIGHGTVKGHVECILGKLAARNRTQAVNIALSRGLIAEVAEQQRRDVAAPVWHGLIAANEG